MEKVISIQIIADKLKRNPLMEKLPLEQIVDYAADFISIVGVPKMFLDKVVTLPIEDNMAILPVDYALVNQVKDSKDHIMEVSSNLFNDEASCRNVYKIQNNTITTSIETGYIVLSYKAIMVDEDGYPYIPDNAEFIRALMDYIKKEYYTILYETGDIPQATLQHAEQSYAWSVGACESEFKRLSIDDAVLLTNSWHRLIIDSSQHKRGFDSLGVEEHIIKH